MSTISTDKSKDETAKAIEANHGADVSTVPSESRSFESITPELPRNLLNNPESVFNSQIEWERDRREIADAKQSALDRFLKASIIQRVELLRDTLAIATTILIGALTLYFVSGSDHIKSLWLFFASLTILGIGIIINLVARMELIRHLQAISLQIESNYLDLYRSSRSFLAKPTETNLDTVWRAENDNTKFPHLKRQGEYGHVIVVWSIALGLIGIAGSMLLTIHV